MAPSNDKPPTLDELDENLFGGNNIVKIKEETKKASPHIVASVLNINDMIASETNETERDYSKEE